MNDLTLRITGGGSKKTKTSIGFAPVVVNNWISDIGANNKFFQDFNQTSSSDNQLTILKTILNDPDEDVIKFLVTVFFHAEPKHPVKCFIARQITKKVDLQDTFATILAEEIRRCISRAHVDYKSYINIVTKLSACVENFPAGAIAVKHLEIPLATYFENCLECCITTLRDNSSLSPTEKNEIFNLAHLVSRLLLHIVQKVDGTNINSLTPLFGSIRRFIQQLLYDGDVPMDTKSVSGILYLSMHLLEYGSDAWIDVLQPDSNTDIAELLKDEAAQLSLYSAITTVVTVDKLQSQIVGNLPACLVLTELLLEIGERSSSESVFILGVSRTLLQLCKMLDKVCSQELGLQMADSLLVFVWAHLEHYMDSVRHLSAQMLSCVVKYCSHLKRQGDDKALSELFSSLLTLDRARKSYYLSITSLTTELGALSVMGRMPGLIPELLAALNVQAVQASATTALEVLLHKHIKESPTDDIHKHWIQPVIQHVMEQAVDSTVLGILEGLLVKAVQWGEGVMDCILPYIKQNVSSTELKCVLMLLRVTRASGVSGDARHAWKGLVGYDVLRRAAVDAADETRILSLSLIVESPKSTEVFSEGDFSFIIYYLKYNMNAQAPNFRQLTLSIMKKFMKRLDDSGKVLHRQKDTHYDVYTRFVEELRELCFCCLLPGANYSRRCVALHVLLWSEHGRGEKVWKREYVDKLLLHLEDSYESNKSFALEILDTCPEEMFKENSYTISTDLEDILKQASSLKPTDCTSAAYKLQLLRRKLPENILQGTVCDTAEPIMYTLLERLLRQLSMELDICTRNIVVGAREGPMYGVLHCIAQLVVHVDSEAIRDDANWTALIKTLIAACVRVTASVSCVVSAAAPEGRVPRRAGGVSLADGRQVTAQMVLLCAWRSVKEVSLLLGTISSRLTIRHEGHPSGTLEASQLVLMGEHFTTLLAETKHRGAFEQAYVGFTRLLDRLWRCKNSELHSLPRAWLSQLMDAIMSVENSSLCATRRGAGVPFMIQALVTSEVQALGSTGCFNSCVSKLIQRCSRTTNKSEALGKSHDSYLKDKQSFEEKVKEDSSEQQNICLEDKELDSLNREITGIDTKKCLQETKDCVEVTETDAMYTTRDKTHKECLQSNSEGTAMDATDNTQDKAHKENLPSDPITTAMDTNTFQGPNGKSMDTEDPQANRDSTAMDAEVWSRCSNVLRALARGSALQAAAAPLLQDALLAALDGFHGRSWTERNSSTLLFSALMVRTFGVTRTRDHDALSLRNKMTGRIFFLRYPRLYDYMLEKLQEVSASEDEQTIHPALYPILLILARLYPSSLEGTVSNLKLVAYIPHVLSCAKSSVLKTRQLAAKAMVPLISPEQYFPHIESMFKILQDRTIKRNYCHGILLQLARLLDAPPEEATDQPRGTAGACGGAWVLEQGLGGAPCYVLVDEWGKVFNLFVWRFPTVLNDETINKVLSLLEQLLFTEKVPKITSGREICLANSLYLYIILLTRLNKFDEVCEIVLKALDHKVYDVVLATLNYILIQHKNLDPENKFHEHLATIRNDEILSKLNNQKYTTKLCRIMKHAYLECRQKCLKILTIEGDTQHAIVNIDNRDVSIDCIVTKLFECIDNSHENLTHIYLEGLSRFVTTNLRRLNLGLMLEVLRTVFACSTPDNKDENRRVVVEFLENNAPELIKLDLSGLSEGDRFEYTATLIATLITTLEDDSDTLRQKTANTILSILGIDSKVISSKCGEMLRDYMQGYEHCMALYVLVALLDFRSEVCVTDEISDECRVFDQNERYNIFLEETVWTSECAKKIRDIHNSGLVDKVLSTIDNPLYVNTMDKLCSNNIVLFKRMLEENGPRDDAVNPKIRLFIRLLN